MAGASQVNGAAANLGLSQVTVSSLERIKSAAPGIKEVQENNLVLLGAPILQAAVDGVLLAKLEDLKRMTGRLQSLDVHDAIFLLRNCYAIPKLTYFLRCAPTFKNMDTLQLYDTEMRSALERILNVELKDEAWEQSSLPIKKGGAGRREGRTPFPTIANKKGGAFAMKGLSIVSHPVYYP